MINSKTSKLVMTTAIVALGLSAQAAQAKDNNQYKAEGTEQQIGLLLPAVQKVRASASTSSSQDGDDLMIINNGDGSDFFEFDLLKYLRSLIPGN